MFAHSWPNLLGLRQCSAQQQVNPVNRKKLPWLVYVRNSMVRPWSSSIAELTCNRAMPYHWRYTDTWRCGPCGSSESVLTCSDRTYWIPPLWRIDGLYGEASRTIPGFACGIGQPGSDDRLVLDGIVEWTGSVVGTSTNYHRSLCNYPVFGRWQQPAGSGYVEASKVCADVR